MFLLPVLQAPFRFVRIVLFGGLTAGAGLGLIVILGRLVQSLRGEGVGKGVEWGGGRREAEGNGGEGESVHCGKKTRDLGKGDLGRKE